MAEAAAELRAARAVAHARRTGQAQAALWPAQGGQLVSKTLLGKYQARIKLNGKRYDLAVEGVARGGGGGAGVMV
jgi:hypothetical protein